ncbi:MAG: MarR family transcriptional regulator [Eubacteriales bacterium]
MSKEIELMKSLFHINKMLHKEVAKFFMEDGLNPTEVMLLYKIKHGSDNQRTIDMSKEMGIPASTFTGMIDRLVEKGYVVRERSEKDRRSVTLRINEEMQPNEKEDNATANHMKEVLSCLADEDKKQLFDAIKKFEEALINKSEK